MGYSIFAGNKFEAMAFFRFILIVILAGWLIQFLFRLIGPPLLNKWLKKRFSHFQEKHPDDGARKKEGEVTINVNSKQNKKVDSNEGDYVDFEEIE